MKTLHHPLLLAGLLAAAAAQAQSMTLQQLFDSAERHNVDRRTAIEQYNKARAEYRQAWTGLLPALTASGTYTHNQYPAAIGPPISPVTITITPIDQFDGALRVDLPLIDTGRWFRSAASGALEDAATERSALARDQMRRGVSQAYYSYAASLKLRDSAKQNIDVSQAQLKLQDIREKAGAATELELLRARAELQRNLQTMADVENLVAVSRRALRTLTGVELGDNIVLPADDTHPEASLAELEGRLEQLPGVRAADKERLATDRLALATKLALVPIVGAQFTERFTNAGGFQGKDALYTYGVNLTWRLDAPTFMAFDAQAANQQVALLAAERTRLASRDQINRDWQSLTASLTKLEAAQAQVTAAERAATVAQARYAVGAATQIDVIQSQRDQFSAEVSLIQARTDLASARVSLRLSAGLSALGDEQR